MCVCCVFVCAHELAYLKAIVRSGMKQACTFLFKVSALLPSDISYRVLYCYDVYSLIGSCLVTSRSVETDSVLLPSGMSYCVLLRHVFTYQFIYSDKLECQGRQCSTS